MTTGEFLTLSVPPNNGILFDEIARLSPAEALVLETGDPAFITQLKKRFPDLVLTSRAEEARAGFGARYHSGYLQLSTLRKAWERLKTP